MTQPSAAPDAPDDDADTRVEAVAESDPRGSELAERIAAADSRIGLALFAVYFLAYAGFVVGNAFFPEMATTIPVPEELNWGAFDPFGLFRYLATTIQGVNLAVLSGMGLIGGAIVLAFVYMILCRWNARSLVRRFERQRLTPQLEGGR